MKISFRIFKFVFDFFRYIIDKTNKEWYNTYCCRHADVV